MSQGIFPSTPQWVEVMEWTSFDENVNSKTFDIDLYPFTSFVIDINIFNPTVASAGGNSLQLKFLQSAEEYKFSMAGFTIEDTTVAEIAVTGFHIPFGWTPYKDDTGATNPMCNAKIWIDNRNEILSSSFMWQSYSRTGAGGGTAKTSHGGGQIHGGIFTADQMIIYDAGGVALLSALSRVRILGAEL